MLTPLRSALGAWQPGAGTARGDAANLAAFWGDVVGAGIAAATRPLERSGDALIVLVPSSAWSNQLSLLSGEILRALRDHGVTGIERLRFRVGKSRKAGARALSSRPAGESGSLPGALPPSENVDEALARFRRSVVRARDAKLARGWKTCRQCGVPVLDGDRCAPCVTTSVAARSGQVQRLMFDAPWLGFSGTAGILEGLSRAEYESNRTELLGRWWARLDRARRIGKLDPSGAERLIASSYLLLKTGWEPDRITPVVARNELGDALHDLLYGDRST